jgi:hypothetical protein
MSFAGTNHRVSYHSPTQSSYISLAVSQLLKF